MAIALFTLWVGAACTVDPDDSIVSDVSLDADRGRQLDLGSSGDTDTGPADTGAPDTGPADTGGDDTGGADTLGGDAPVDAPSDLAEEAQIDGFIEDEDQDGE